MRETPSYSGLDDSKQLICLYLHFENKPSNLEFAGLPTYTTEPPRYIQFPLLHQMGGTLHRHRFVLAYYRQQRTVEIKTCKEKALVRTKSCTDLRIDFVHEFKFVFHVLHVDVCLNDMFQARTSGFEDDGKVFQRSSLRRRSARRRRKQGKQHTVSALTPPSTNSKSLLQPILPEA